MDIICFGGASHDIFVHLNPKIAGNAICFPFGAKTEINQLDYFSGGGATNTSAGFSRLGLKTGIVTVVGGDLEGKELLAELKKEKVNTFGAFCDKKAKTSCSVILTGFGHDRVILNYSKTLNALAKHHVPWKKLNAKWFYISSLHAKPALLKKLVEFAHKKQINVALNIGSAELSGGLKKLAPTLKKTTVLLLNAQEAQMLAGSKSIPHNLSELSKLSKITVITDGKNGSAAQSGGKTFFQKAFSVKIADTTGAGDAFCCAFVASMIKGKQTGYALAAGAANASSVIRHLGAKNILLNQTQLGKTISQFRKK
ncbi:MAG: carbohydrate kinase family protein [archaeon]